MKIGVFDSGLGGLSILKALRKGLPSYDYLYLEIIFMFLTVTALVRRLFLGAENYPLFIKKDCALVIFACNTVTRWPSRQFRRNSEKIKILGIIRPTSEFLAHHFGKIGFIGTTNTIKANIFIMILRKFSPKRTYFCQKDCPD